MKVAGCLHVTKETAVLIRTLRAAGAEVSLVGLQPAVDPGRRRRGARRRGHVDLRLARPVQGRVLLVHRADARVQADADARRRRRPDLHRARPSTRSSAKDVIGGTEETTTGVHRLRAMANDGKLLVPGHRRQRQRDQVGLRQRLRHRPVVARRHPARDRRCCSPARPSSSPATATAAAASPMRATRHGRQRHRHRDQADRGAQGDRSTASASCRWTRPPSSATSSSPRPA